MNKAVRKAVIAGNWKMNKTPAEAKELITALLRSLRTQAATLSLACRM